MRLSTWPGGARLYLPWVGFAGLCTLLMWALPGDETIPYHLAWIGLALAYAREAWPWRPTQVTVAVFTAVTGLVLVVRAWTGVLAWEETAEIPLMAVLVVLVLHNVHVRQLAHAALEEMTAAELERAAGRERLRRMTSHEMRAPATIAIGYTDVLLAQETDPGRRADLEVVRDELERLVRAGDRAVRSSLVHDRDLATAVSVDGLLGEVAHRWGVLVERSWSVTAPPLVHRCVEERVRACLDTLVENAVRYTRDGDAIALTARRERGWLVVGVADAGPGLHPTMVAAINAGELDDGRSFRLHDALAQTGLGLAMVQGVATSAGGALHAGTSRHGGALVELRLPPSQPGGATRGSAPAPCVTHVELGRHDPVAGLR